MVDNSDIQKYYTIAQAKAEVVEDEQDGITRTNELLSELIDKISDLNETGGKTNE